MSDGDESHDMYIVAVVVGETQVVVSEIHVDEKNQVTREVDGGQDTHHVLGWIGVERNAESDLNEVVCDNYNQNELPPPIQVRSRVNDEIIKRFRHH